MCTLSQNQATLSLTTTLIIELTILNSEPRLWMLKTLLFDLEGMGADYGKILREFYIGHIDNNISGCPSCPMEDVGVSLADGRGS